VLSGHGVSLTCCVVRSTGVWWWLTRESGKLCSKCSNWKDPELGCQTCLSWHEGASVPVRSYFVLKSVGVDAEDGVICKVAFAQLTKAVLETCVERIVPVLCEISTGALEDVMELRAGVQQGWWKTVESLYVQLHLGLFSCGDKQQCTVGSVCTECASLPDHSRVFWEENSFYGVFPSGAHHPWSGVTDAAGIVQVRRARQRLWSECMDGWRSIL
jgi:hypothetical protein